METGKLKRRVLLLYRTFGPSVNLCGYIQLDWLAKNGAVAFRHKRITDVQTEDLNWAEVVVFVRGDGLLDELLAGACHRAGKYILYILDDDLLNVPLELGSGPYYAQRSVKRHIRRMLAYSDCFASPSPVLLEKYGGLCRSAFSLIEPAAYCLPEKRANEDGRVHIGFAGSSDRGSDIDRLISGALVETAKRYGERVKIEFFGVETETARKLGCETYPYTESYEEYQRAMARLNWDIGLAPMPDTAFHACKHYNKLVEYCGFGVVGIYSDLPPYTGAVEDRVTGLLCENSQEGWAGALSELIENSALRREMAENCLERARGVFSVETAARELQKALDALDIPETTDQVRISLGRIKAKGLVSWYLEKFKKYGWRTPAVAVKKLVYLIRKEK